ncbi:PadR family transcriptional regulator [Microbacterium sp. H1-D42]|uniref:PadR family transcriptional regulator n=1 Tax=Microbacterium sp. H1-D42 TaxID=2925844 RepID=UPI001F53799C|nr:PadR family transcriptional regulator [Microbacterium sp. H1-D42]UNK69435.1 PadR family transcriptional regulator [Microbacterium sp. H1-D42]
MSTSISEPSFWILSALAGGRRHGYGIMQDAAQLSGGRATLKVPTLYATLERLEKGGLVRADGEEVVDGRARRYYALTEAGTIALREEAEALQARARIATERLAGNPRAAWASAAFA